MLQGSHVHSDGSEWQNADEEDQNHLELGDLSQQRRRHCEALSRSRGRGERLRLQLLLSKKIQVQAHHTAVSTLWLSNLGCASVFNLISCFLVFCTDLAVFWSQTRSPLLSQLTESRAERKVLEFCLYIARSSQGWSCGERSALDVLQHNPKRLEYQRKGQHSKSS